MSKGTPIDDAWKVTDESETVKITTNDVQHQQPPILQQPVQYIFPPQQNNIEQQPQQDIVTEVNNMLAHTEEYLLRQIAEFHRSSYSQISKLMSNSNTETKLAEQLNNKPFFIAIIVLLALLLLLGIFTFFKFQQKFSALHKMFYPHATMFNAL